MNTMNEQIAKDLIAERSQARRVSRRPQHPRAARVLRKWASRLDGD